MESQLFQPATLGLLTLSNRFVRSATWEGMADTEGLPTERLLALYRELAEGNIGLIITGYTAVHPMALQFPGTLRLDSDSQVRPMKQLTAAVHEAGSRVVCQLFHGGGQTGERNLGQPGWAPSGIAFPSYDGIPHEMTLQQIRETILAFGQAALRARQAGFDGVQLHAAHGYLIHQFLSPLTNRRSDGYGGTLEDRMRFLLEIVTTVRKTAGEDFPLLVKLNGDDHLEGGFSSKDLLVVAAALEEAGVTALEISAGSPASGTNSPIRTDVQPGENEGFNADLAAEVRRWGNLPVITVGGLRSPETVDRLWQQGIADFFALSRPLIRQPDLIRNWRQGDSSPSRCISCNACFRPGLKEGGIYCPLERTN